MGRGGGKKAKNRLASPSFRIPAGIEREGKSRIFADSCKAARICASSLIKEARNLSAN